MFVLYILPLSKSQTPVGGPLNLLSLLFFSHLGVRATLTY